MRVAGGVPVARDDDLIGKARSFAGWANCRNRRALRYLRAQLGDPRPFSTDVIVARLTDILGSAEPERTQPIGILTHHRVIDAPSWSSIEAVFVLIASSPGTQWSNPRHLFALEGLRIITAGRDRAPVPADAAMRRNQSPVIAISAGPRRVQADASGPAQ
jgi:hypothetical protein